MDDRRRVVLALVLLVSACAVFLIADQAPTSLLGMPIIALAMGAYLWLVLRPERARMLGARPVVAAIAIVMVVAVATPPRGSRDLWAYAMYGRIVSIHHGSPYVDLPADYPADPALKRMSPRFVRTPSVYGPVFTGISAAGTSALPDGVATRLFFQVLAMLATLAALVLIWRRTRDPAAIAFLGLHPVIALSVINGGHNDPLVGLAILGGVLFIGADRRIAAGVVIALGALVKIAAVLPLAAVAIWAWRRRGARAGASVALSGGATIAIAYAAFGGMAAVRALSAGRQHISVTSIWIVVRRALGQLTHPVDAPWGGRLVSTIAIATLAAFALRVIARFARGAKPETVVGASLLVYLVASPYVLPWYAAWALPMLAWRWTASGDRLTHDIARAVTMMSALLPMVYWTQKPHPPVSARASVYAVTGLLWIFEIYVAVRLGRARAEAAESLQRSRARA